MLFQNSEHTSKKPYMREVMRSKVWMIALVLFGVASAYGQEESKMPTLGLKVGVPVTDMFSTNSSIPAGVNTTGAGSSYSFAVPRYEFGVSSEFHLPLHLRFEVDGLFKRGGYDSGLPFGATGALAYRPTTFNWWEVPGLFKYNVAMGHFRPFVDFGATFRHISTITQTTYAPGALFGTLDDNAMELRNRNSYGAVAGFGMTFKKGPFELTPEARYTRWANEAFETTGLRTNLDQGDVLLGIGF
jgi:hypothetical protein